MNIDPLPDWNLDPPAEPDMMECGACAGVGFLGCTPACWVEFGPVTKVKVRDRICLANHTCIMCKGEGAIPMTPEMERDERDAAAEARWECAREERMGEDKE